MSEASQRAPHAVSSSPRRGQERFGFKRAFLRGLGVLLPSLLTLWILVACYQFVDRNIAEPLNGFARTMLAQASTAPGPLGGAFEPSEATIATRMAEHAARSRNTTEAAVTAELRAEAVSEWWDSHWWTGLFGLVVALGIVYVAGRLVGGFLGRRAFLALENLLTRLPVLKQVYPNVKQIVGFFFADDAAEGKRMRFSRVVVVQYPRPGIWSIGLLTGPAMRSIEEEAGDAMTVFVPSSPTPFTGYTITVPKSDVRELPITIDEALKYLVSGGVLVPPRQEGLPRDPLPPKQPSLART